MLGILLDRLLKNNKFRDTIIRHSFFLFNGMIGGLLLNDLLLLLYGNFEDKEYLQYGVGVGVMSLPTITGGRLILFDNASNNISMGAGIMLGTYLANRSENKEPLIK